MLFFVSNQYNSSNFYMFSLKWKSGQIQKIMLSVNHISKNADVYISNMHNLMLFLLVAFKIIACYLQVFWLLICIHRILLIKQYINLLWELKLNDQMIVVDICILKTSDLKCTNNILKLFIVKLCFYLHTITIQCCWYNGPLQ